eukprot:TRINITY_DN2079_c0_g2_i1.p1 TRINITY_DN2079_c0_g2~~TRINITY_DN2079_c0_g2_i1.p1  ORF type:complete len:111 (+),score=15.10 TRINITY_DN2079_c0_g2_i1:154-486(+)
MKKFTSPVEKCFLTCCGLGLELVAGFVVDKEDHSVTRSDAHFLRLFQKCGLHLLKARYQRTFPRELFKVRMYALSCDKEEEVAGGGRTHGSSAGPARKRPRVRNQPGVIL